MRRVVWTHMMHEHLQCAACLSQQQSCCKATGGQAIVAIWHGQSFAVHVASSTAC
jgi:hypothetical protein